MARNVPPPAEVDLETTLAAAAVPRDALVGVSSPPIAAGRPSRSSARGGCAPARTAAALPVLCGAGSGSGICAAVLPPGPPGDVKGFHATPPSAAGGSGARSCCGGEKDSKGLLAVAPVSGATPGT
eukprot:364694-Chlamydomonas_euryale.AAC.10